MWLEKRQPSNRIDAPSSLPPLIWRILESRDISSEEEAFQILNPKLADLSHPNSLESLDVAIDRLIEARSAHQQLAVYGDFDLDGTSGAAMLYEGFQLLGFKPPLVYQPNRLTEGYGFHAAAVEKLRQQGADLIVTVDVGITAIEACEVAKQQGIDVIITDHHQSKEQLPDALAVINPNKPGCGSNLGHLSGTGVGYYLLLGLNAELKKRDLIAEAVDLKCLLDFFAIGTVTDMVPLKAENRVLVKHGLNALSKTQRPGLQALLKELKLYGIPMTSADLAIGFAPKLNALSRLQADVQPIQLYLEKDAATAVELTKQTMEVNKNRVRLQKFAEQEAVELAKAQAQDGFVWVYSQNFHKGVIGLVATKLAAMFDCPAFVGALKDGQISGSARAPKNFNERLSVLIGLEAAASALDGFGGHHAAAGFQMTIENVENFNEQLQQHFQDLRHSEQQTVTPGSMQHFDAVARLSEVNAGFMKWYSTLEPFGVGFETPILKSENVKICSLRELKGGHFKLSVEQDLPGYRMDAIWFSPPSQVGEQLRLGMTIDIYYQVQWNYFAGRRSLQLLIQNIEPRDNLC